jgi:cation diffusion facilitator CzcD-associated flavoprotein CzcO
MQNAVTTVVVEMSTAHGRAGRSVPHWRVAIIGAGAGGLGLAIGLAKSRRRDFVIFEASDGVGGTWRSNANPGAACDLPSHLCSYSFALKADWSRPTTR